MYADANFPGSWYKPTVADNTSMAKTRSGFIIFYAGCFTVWSSKLQIQVALSTTESEYISLLQSLREVIPIINLIKEMQEIKMTNISTVPSVYYKHFEDNSGALEIAKCPEMGPRTKHINWVYHHFRDHVRKRIIQLFPTFTKILTSGYLYGTLPRDLFLKFREKFIEL